MPSRYLGAMLLALAALCTAGLFTVGLITAAPANAAISAPPPPVVPPPGGATLTQQSDGTWTTSAYLDTGSLCDDTFDLVTGAPATDKTDTAVTYTSTTRITSTAPCGAGQPAVTEVGLTFPAMPDGAIPQTATLVVTPSATSLAAGATPAEFALTVRRQLAGASSLWIPVWFGVGFVVLLVAFVAIGGAKDDGGARHRGWRSGFWGATLYAPSAWTFGGAWATNFTALGTVIGGVLAATGAVAGIVPGVDLGRIGLLFAVFGAFAVIAPLLFATLNARFSDAPKAADGVDVAAAKMWIMLAASSFTAFGMGASLGLVGWVLTYRLVVAPAAVRWCIGIGIIAVGLLFLINAGVSIVAMADRSEDGTTAGAAAGRTVHFTAGSTADTAEHLASTPSVHVARTSFML
ncbi:MAG: hypothetical protein WBQ71_28580 [Trebonia sp.]